MLGVVASGMVRRVAAVVLGGALTVALVAPLAGAAPATQRAGGGEDGAGGALLPSAAGLKAGPGLSGGQRPTASFQLQEATIDGIHAAMRAGQLS